MDKIARLAAKERSDLFTETAAGLGMTPAIVEKDFWVSWVLAHLFQDQMLASLLMFKGRTSLSKTYHLICSGQVFLATELYSIQYYADAV